MGLIGVVIPDKLENELRMRCRKKGDLSKIVANALTEHFKTENKR